MCSLPADIRACTFFGSFTSKDAILTCAFELEKSRMEHEFRMRNLGNAEQGGGDADRGQDSQNGRAARMKAVKLPPFNKEKDDLDGYLTRFERACIAFEIRTEHWSTQLARLFKVDRWRYTSV